MMKALKSRLKFVLFSYYTVGSKCDPQTGILQRVRIYCPRNGLVVIYAGVVREGLFTPVSTLRPHLQGETMLPF